MQTYIVKFKSGCIDKSSHNKRSDILQKFFNKMSGQIYGQKVQTIYNLEQREYYIYDLFYLQIAVLRSVTQSTSNSIYSNVTNRINKSISQKLPALCLL